MENHGRSDGITTLFDRALTSNGEALSIYNAMLPAEQQAFRARGEGLDAPALTALMDELVGWKVGHFPYEL